MFDPKRFWEVNIIQLQVRQAHINFIKQQIAFTESNVHNRPEKRVQEHYIPLHYPAKKIIFSFIVSKKFFLHFPSISANDIER